MTVMKRTFSTMLLAAVACAAAVASGAQQPDTSRPVVTASQFERWLTELSNWGRWGPDDELGAFNLVTPARRAAAAALVTEGFTVSLASDAQTRESLDNPCPIEWSMVRASRSSASDTVAYPCIHGPGTTHLDAFAHIFFDGKMWNGYDVANVVTMEDGATKNSILNMMDGIVTRGVLYDIPRLKGVPYLEPGTRIYVEDLEAWEEMTGVRVGPGDAFLVRWGRWARQDDIGPFDTGREAAGLDNAVIPWLRERDVALGVGDPRLHAAAGRRPAPARPPQLRLDDAGHPPARPRRLPGAERGGRRTGPLGVHADHRAASDPERHRLASESDRDVLARTLRSQKTGVRRKLERLPRRSERLVTGSSCLLPPGRIRASSPARRRPDPGPGSGLRPCRRTSAPACLRTSRSRRCSRASRS